MREPTHVQRIVRRSQNAVPELPQSFAVAEQFLQGLGADEFMDGLRALQAAVLALHEAARENPAAYGLCESPAEELRVNHPVTPEEQKARKSFFRVATAFAAIAAGELRGGELAVPGGALWAAGISRPHLALALLRDCGFAFEGLAPSGAPHKDRPFFVSFPDNRFVPCVLKAYALVADPHPALRGGMAILHAEWRPFAADRACFAYDVADMLRGLPELDARCVAACYAFMCGAGYAPHVADTGGLELDFVTKGERQRLLTIKRERDDLRVRAKFLHLPGFAGALASCTPGVRNAVLNGPDCRGCGCANPVRFTYLGESYEKCQMISLNFTFPIASDEDIRSLLLLAQSELRLRRAPAS